MALTVKVSPARFYRFWYSGLYAFTAISVYAERLARYCAKRALVIEVSK